MTTILVTSQELVPISATHAGTAITPDEVAVVLTGTALSAITDDEFYTPATLDGASAVWVRDLDPGIYKVVCRMNTQTDQQRPVWVLTGSINVQPRV